MSDAMLPPPEVYEQEYRYFPWGKLVSKVIDYVAVRAPRKGVVLDAMCGTGHLLAKINERRPDLSLRGVDIDERYISYARRNYPRIAYAFKQGDVRDGLPSFRYDAVLCTAGLHHLPYAVQPAFVRSVSRAVRPSGFCVLADPFMRAFSDEQTRQLPAAELGYAYLRAAINAYAPQEVVRASIQILENDVLGYEFKRDVNGAAQLYEESFSHVERHRTWPRREAAYGEHYFILREPRTPVDGARY